MKMEFGEFKPTFNIVKSERLIDPESMYIGFSSVQA